MTEIALNFEFMNFLLSGLRVYFGEKSTATSHSFDVTVTEKFCLQVNQVI